MDDFKVNLQLEKSVARLSMSGDLTHLAEERMATIFEKIQSSGARFLVLDFRRVEYINSAGMSVLITLLTRSQKAGLELRAFGLSPHYQKIFDMVGLLKYIPHFDSEESAFKGLPS
ncbi:MAG: STAS domain-containing protein [candidate division KSB1 bacterium]|nr:STAS domain-containing protein [candidate division KSB1 bacterium]MDQ7065690.1 STAS domain-containing protein [candidate division KSB1 bacterium]